MDSFTYKPKPYQQKRNNFTFLIQQIAEKYGFASNPITFCFKQNAISSADFSLNRFKKRKHFAIEFCKKKNITIAYGKLIKVWDALNREYNLSSNGPIYQIRTAFEIFNEKSLVYISQSSTRSIIENHSIKEPFSTAARLYQYLNWSIRINKINQFIHCFRTSNGIRVMVINSELHNKDNQVLYILCIINDVISTKAQKWQFVKLVTAEEIMALTKTDLLISGFFQQCSLSSVSCVTPNIPELIHAFYGSNITLPIGARSGAPQFEKRLLSKQEIYDRHGNIKKSSFGQLKSVQTSHYKNKSQRTLRVSLDEFYNSIKYALRSNDIRHELIPILSILTGRRYKDGNYSIDQLLPVNISGNWIGILYRNGRALGTLIDVYDILNKAILCDPNFDRSTLIFFTNNVTKIEITLNYNRCYNMPHLIEDNTPPVFEMNNPVISPVNEGNPTTNNKLQSQTQINSNGTNINATPFNPVQTKTKLSAITEGYAIAYDSHQTTLPKWSASVPIISAPQTNTIRPPMTIVNGNIIQITNNTHITMPTPIVLPPFIPIPGYYTVLPINAPIMNFNGLQLQYTQPQLLTQISKNYIQSHLNQAI